MISQVTYRALLDGIIEAQKWFDSIDLKKERDRFNQMIKNLELVTNHFENGTTDRLKEIIETPSVFYSMTDAIFILDIYRSLKSLKNHQIPRAKLNKILTGPVVPYAEDPSKSTNSARNYLFELQIASLFMKGNIVIKGFDDVVFDFEDKQYCIECKRLMSHKYVEERIIEAIDSIQAFTLLSAKNRGMIALSIEKLYGIDNHFLNTSNGIEIRNAVLPILTDFQQKYGQIWYNILNMQFVCVILSISGIAAEIKTGNINSVWQMKALDRLPRSASYFSADQQQLRRLFTQCTVDG